jgi:hypothetical protein
MTVEFYSEVLGVTSVVPALIEDVLKQAIAEIFEPTEKASVKVLVLPILLLDCLSLS